MEKRKKEEKRNLKWIMNICNSKLDSMQHLGCRYLENLVAFKSKRA